MREARQDRGKIWVQLISFHWELLAHLSQLEEVCTLVSFAKKHLLQSIADNIISIKMPADFFAEIDIMPLAVVLSLGGYNLPEVSRSGPCWHKEQFSRGCSYELLASNIHTSR